MGTKSTNVEELSKEYIWDRLRLTNSSGMKEAYSGACVEEDQMKE